MTEAKRFNLPCQRGWTGEIAGVTAVKHWVEPWCHGNPIEPGEPGSCEETAAERETWLALSDREKGVFMQDHRIDGIEQRLADVALAHEPAHTDLLSIFDQMCGLVHGIKKDGHFR